MKISEMEQFRVLAGEGIWVSPRGEKLTDTQIHLQLNSLLGACPLNARIKRSPGAWGKPYSSLPPVAFQTPPVSLHSGEEGEWAVGTRCSHLSLRKADLSRPGPDFQREASLLWWFSKKLPSLGTLGN